MSKRKKTGKFQKSSASNGWLTLVIVLAAALVIILLLTMFLRGRKETPPPEETDPPVVAQTPTPGTAAEAEETAEPAPTDTTGETEPQPPTETGAAETGGAETQPPETQAPTQPPVTQPPKDDDNNQYVPVDQPTMPTEPMPEVEIEAVQISCDRYSRFSGQFMEDGRDELVDNVAAMLVTNLSDQFLDVATISYLIDGKEATFVATGLPAGTSAWVLESSRMTIPSKAEFTYVYVTTGFREGVTATTDKVTITASGNMLTAVNNTGTTLKGVYAYYKVRHSDGNFLGGITYLADFGDLEPGVPVETLAGHFSSNAQIVRIGWQE